MKTLGVSCPGIRINWLKKGLKKKKLNYRKKSKQSKRLLISKFKREKSKGNKSKLESKIWTNLYSRRLKRRSMKKKNRETHSRLRLCNKKALGTR